MQAQRFIVSISVYLESAFTGKRLIRYAGPVNHYESVSRLTQDIKNTLQNGFSGISLEAEVSNFKPASSGHWYFTLKDESATIQAVMFRGRSSRVPFLPQDGMQVRVMGTVSVYEQRGQYQIICDAMAQAGLGKILQTLERRKQMLASEGLFEADRKRPLPLFPRRIGIVTSATGAAIRDILQVLKRRNRGSSIVLLPAAVQGADAPSEIADQIRRANTFGLADVLIVGRGGGSLEDLLAFSSEEVVRAIAESGIPTISAVGHETDTSLSDFAADLRAPTPSAAAELVTAQQDQLYLQIVQTGQSIVASFLRRRERLGLALRPFSSRALEDSFRTYLQPKLQRLDDASEQLFRGMQDALDRRRHRLNMLKTELSALSPLSILSRGYAIVLDEATRKILRSHEELTSGQEIGIVLATGSASAKVQQTSQRSMEWQNSKKT